MERRPKSQYRFFLPPDSIEQDVVKFPSTTWRQITAVLRLSTGDLVTVLDGSGLEFDVQLGPSRDGRVLSTHRNLNEAGIAIHLYQAVLKTKKFEFVVQKSTELGVASITPIATARSNSTREDDRSLRTGEIMREAGEQSGRGVLPALEPVKPFTVALQEARGAKLIFSSSEAAGRLGDDLNAQESFSLFIGPEGGFSQEELVAAGNAGCRPVTLGRLTLRAETAAVVATALVLDRYSKA